MPSRADICQLIPISTVFRRIDIGGIQQENCCRGRVLVHAEKLRLQQRKIELARSSGQASKADNLWIMQSLLLPCYSIKITDSHLSRPRTMLFKLSLGRSIYSQLRVHITCVKHYL